MPDISDVVHLKILLILTIGFGLASILGYVSHRIQLSPILGYLLAGYLIGPNSPGFEADREISEQLAEIGVILMMFGVGLHFKLEDLLAVKRIAIPGAIGQTLVATAVGAVLMHGIGWSWQAGMVFGLAIGVASTVVLSRMLSHYRLLHTTQGHIAIGWLIVEDLITVIALLLVPALAASQAGLEVSITELAGTTLMRLFKFFIFAVLMFTVGRWAVRWVLAKVVQTNLNELLTLATLALIFVISTGSAILFGTSIVLGAFVAGMVIGQTDVRHQVSTNARPLKDTFMVIFFLSIGMLFSPAPIMEHPILFLAILAVILVAKPIAAFTIAYLLKYPFGTALTVAVALAQIGEFSFVLAQQAMSHGVMPAVGFDLIVACALVSIAINPLLFKLLKRQTA
jgi:monovalent cation:H+ antiporter-2, CPA2 family